MVLPIISYFQNLERKLDKIDDSLTYKFKFDFSRIYNWNNKELFWDIDDEQFKLLFENFVENSLTHGFIEMDVKSDRIINIYVMPIYVPYNIDDIISGIDGRRPPGFDALWILFQNNGKPKDPELTMADYTGRSIKKGKTGNTGIGGSIIADVVRNLNGKITGFSDPKKSKIYNFGIKMEIPKYYREIDNIKK